jgi:Flp pilus assembly protein TadD
MQVSLLDIHRLADSGDLDKASEHIAEVLNQDPDDPKALSVAAYIYMKAERFGFGAAFLHRALALMPDQPALWNNLGMCELGCMRLEAAEEALKQSLKLDPLNVPAMNNLALVNVNKCEPGKAIYWANKSREHLRLCKASPGRLERGLAGL